MRKYKIVFLVPVFEREDCVEDLVLNIQHFCPNSAIVLHVNSKSSDFYYNNICKIADYYSHCYIAPMRYPSDWGAGYLARVYVEMMQWCLQNIEFDYIYLTASNSLIVNPNLEKDIYNYELYSWEPWPQNESNGWWECISKDYKLFEYSPTVYGCVFEGSAYNVACSKLMIKELYDILQYDPYPYPTEEYWIPSAIKKIINQYDVKFANYAMEVWSHVKDGVVHNYHLQVDAAEEYISEFIQKGDYGFLSSVRIYSVKRVPRAYGAPLRVMIRENYNYTNKLF